MGIQDLSLTFYPTKRLHKIQSFSVLSESFYLFSLIIFSHFVGVREKYCKTHEHRVRKKEIG